MLAPLPRDGYRGAMDITYLGHAGFAIGQEGHLLVLDPWLSPSGAYGQGWFQWPPNHFMREKFIARIKSLPPGSVTFYISHEHRDHFDPETLEAILAATPGSSPLFVVPAFEEKSFET
ncbi:MAG: MBL fold metallo-hydrolase [Alphaproteobacteria bacterium]